MLFGWYVLRPHRFQIQYLLGVASSASTLTEGLVLGRTHMSHIVFEDPAGIKPWAILPLSCAFDACGDRVSVTLL